MINQKPQDVRELTSVYKGGKTQEFVRLVIAQRWGETEGEKYNPLKNCFTYRGWIQRGFVVKKGEKAIPSYTFIKEKLVDPETGEKVGEESHKKRVCLFYKLQVKSLKKGGK